VFMTVSQLLFNFVITQRRCRTSKLPYTVYCIRKVHKATPLTNTVFLITFSVMMLSAPSIGMTVNTDVAGIGCQFRAEPRNFPARTDENDDKIWISTFIVQSKFRKGHLTNESHHVSKHKSCSLYGFTEVREWFRLIVWTPTTLRRK
jgi:hypothetical protein